MKQKKEMKNFYGKARNICSSGSENGGGGVSVSHYCQVEHVDMISIMLFLLVVHKTPPETIVFDPKETNASKQRYGDGNKI